MHRTPGRVNEGNLVGKEFDGIREYRRTDNKGMTQNVQARGEIDPTYPGTGSARAIDKYKLIPEVQPIKRIAAICCNAAIWFFFIGIYPATAVLSF